MIAYVDCLSKEPAGKCWNRTYYEDEDELLPLYTRKLSNLHPKTEGSLRRRLLTSKIHQQQDALWRPKCWDGPPSPKSISLPPKQPGCTFRPAHQDWKGWLLEFEVFAQHEAGQGRMAIEAVACRSY
ncbi:hypothetical protein SRHO_G00133470 [Serrasalmus rhombeus]